jgi:hypothetical protein
MRDHVLDPSCVRCELAPNFEGGAKTNSTFYYQQFVSSRVTPPLALRARSETCVTTRPVEEVIMQVACWQGRPRACPSPICLIFAPGVEGATRCHGCRVRFASGISRDGSVEKVLRIHPRWHQPVLLVVEDQSTLRSVAARPQLARLRHHQSVGIGNMQLVGAPSRC